MKKVLCILARTGVDLHGEMMQKETLDNMVSMIKSPTAPCVGVSHDPTVPPIGKVIDAWVEKGDDGEYELKAIQEIFEDAKEIVLLDGCKLYVEGSTTDDRPFNECFHEQPEKLTIEYDPINFEPKIMHDFLSELRKTIVFDEEQLVRKAEIPDPIMIINIGKTLLITLFSSMALKNLADKFIEKTSDKLAEEVSEDVAKFYAFAKEAVLGMIKNAKPKNRPIAYIFRLPANPIIDFIAKTNDANLVTEAIKLEKIKATLESKEAVLKQLKPLKVQFLLDDKGDWQLNYLLTKDGKVIGTKESFQRRPIWIKEPKPGTGMSLTARRTKKLSNNNDS